MTLLFFFLPSALYEELSAAKFSREFWTGLSVWDNVRYDYKQFSATGANYGIASVLLPCAGRTVSTEPVLQISNFSSYFICLSIFSKTTYTAMITSTIAVQCTINHINRIIIG